MAKILLHLGEGPTRETYEWDPNKMLMSERDAMEQVTGLIGSDLDEALGKEGAGALRALIWVLRKRTHSRLQYQDVDFASGDLTHEIVNDDGTPVKAAGEDPDEDAGEPESEPEVPKAAEES